MAAADRPHVMQQQVLDHHDPLPREEGACAVPRIASRAGAVGQICIAIAALAVLSREPRNVAIIFWRQEAMVATVASLFWVACAWNSGRRQAVAFLAANALAWGFSLLLPILNY